MIGSAKSCFSHTEGAAGFTGMLLSMDVLQRCCFPSVLHLRTVNNYVATALSDWWAAMNTVIPKQNSPVSCELDAAGSSSFGMSGTNAHALLQARSNTTLLLHNIVWSRARWVGLGNSSRREWRALHKNPCQ